MRDTPLEIKKGPFNVEPESGGRNARIKYVIGNQELVVERADVPELIEALQEAYDLRA